ncbi:MAG: GntR family transcriptional regulator [Solirubrobacterales bacterium]|nr:GntR family transcriptional regulator [Solirubrobacterales bacterium]
MTEEANGDNVNRINASSVVTLAYEELRALILAGDLEPGSRLAQASLADQLGTSRTPVREALRRLAVEGLVEFHPNRGFWTSDLGLDAVLRRLEVRLILEPGIAALAAERRTDEDLEALAAAIEREATTSDPAGAHDASREFHIQLAKATRNAELERALESLWIVEVGRRLLARRATVQDWQTGDVEEHRHLLAAVEAQEPERAAALMAKHVQDALRHWEH